jgi:hypothetical protein
MYGKIFAQMYDGSLYGQWQALVTFQQLIVLSDPVGVVDMTPQAIAARTSIPLEIIRQGIADLEEPDPNSRTPDEDGRRIIRLSDHRTWGWRIVNHGHYRKLRSQEERREYMREYQRRRRHPEQQEALDNPVNQTLTSVSTSKQSQPITVSNKQDTEDRTTPLPPFTNGANAPGVALTLHRNGNGRKGKAVAKKASASLGEVKHRLAELVTDLGQAAEGDRQIEKCREAMVELVFAYWAAKLSPTSKLDTKRFNHLRALLMEASDDVHLLLFTVDGALKDDLLMGRKDGRKFTQVRTVFRDYEQVERLAHQGGYKEGKIHPMAAKHLAPILTEPHTISVN